VDLPKERTIILNIFWLLVRLVEIPIGPISLSYFSTSRRSTVVCEVLYVFLCILIKRQVSLHFNSIPSGALLLLAVTTRKKNSKGREILFTFPSLKCKVYMYVHMLLTDGLNSSSWYVVCGFFTSFSCNLKRMINEISFVNCEIRVGGIE
jgi:hypothetical protein